MEEEFDQVYNYLTRNHYPEGLTKDEKRNFRRKVANQQLYADIPQLIIIIMLTMQATGNYKAEDGKLYYSKQARKGEANNGQSWKMCVRSEEEKLRVLQACHASSTGMLLMCMTYLSIPT